MTNSLSKNFKAGDLYTANLKTLDKLNMPHDSFSEFAQGLKNLESYGLINYSEGKNPKGGKVSLKASIDEIRNGITI
jgi:Cdc6-like AAA superfamily ATPase